mmetsp:Transcript_59765/g.139213  ORF Transcript_59765/g.139213 Transcript_59765/m.139213 type:complete len:750 (+) Transcript_59765:49-2298(+)
MPCPSADGSFEELIQSLAAVHEQQQEVIRALTEENEYLRSRLGGSTSLTTLRLGEDSLVVGEKGRLHTLRLGEESALNVLKESEGDSSPSCTPPLDCPSSPTSHIFPPTLAVETERVPVRPEDRIIKSTELSLATSQSFQLPDVWPEWIDPQPPPKKIRRSSVTSLNSNQLCVIEDTTGQAMMVSTGCCSENIVIRPNSFLRLSWDFLSGLMVCYDVITIPLVAFSVTDDFMGSAEDEFMGQMDWVTTCFWSLDIPFSFLSGYHGEGVVEMRPKVIACHYLKTWFPFDFLIISFDWAILYVRSVGREADALGIFRVGKTARVARILRAVRLLRFVRLQRVVSDFIEMINSESIRALFNVILAVAFIITINHYLACGWYVVGTVGIDRRVPNWIESNDMAQSSEVYCYLTSLHWSLTQFTPASMEIRPYNIIERVYSIAALLFALITFSSFLGSITASITQLRKHTTESAKQKHILRNYFTKNNVSTVLSREIWTFLKNHHFAHQTRSHKAQIHVLTLLPQRLQSKLHLELYGPYLTRAPFFYHYTAISCEGLMELSTRAVTEKAILCGEDLFLAGRNAEKMIFIVSGIMNYDHVDADFNTNIGTGSWAAEPVLWVKWVHWGRLCADTSCEIIELHSAKFRTIMAAFAHSLPFVKMYGRHFVEHLHSMGTTGQTDVLTNVCRLENVARRAWCDVTSKRDQTQFQSMPTDEFPRLSRSERVQSLIWEYKPQIKWPSCFKCFLSRRRSCAEA